MTDTSGTSIDAATLEAVRAFAAAAARRFPLREAVLFGSRACGTARPDSDADVMLLLDGATGAFMETKLDLADIAFDAMLDSGVRVQPLPVWDDEWRDPDRWVNPELLRNIRHAGISVWPFHST